MELVEKLGRNDLCPCGSGRRFQAVLPDRWSVRWRRTRLLLSGTKIDDAAAVRGWPRDLRLAASFARG
ncbi:MAG: SEC-C metal-binding domain-containing protein [Hyphomicrobiaceae bacterium]